MLEKERERDRKGEREREERETPKKTFTLRQSVKVVLGGPIYSAPACIKSMSMSIKDVPLSHHIESYESHCNPLTCQHI